MTTTTYGYENPSSGDASKGASGWMAQLNFDITRLDGHSHNGIDSVLLTSSSFAALTVIALIAGWTVSGSGYKQNVTVPTGVGDINNYSVRFVVSTAGATQYQALYLQFNRTSATTFDLYCNDNTIDVLCIFR